MLILRRMHCGFAAGFLAVLGGAAGAQSVNDADTLYPAPIRAIELEAGQQWRLSEPQQDQVFYRAAWYGALLDSRGTPFKDAEHIDLDAPKPAAAGGDRNQLQLRLQDGRAEFGGGFFDAAGVMPLQLAGLEKLRLRGSGTMAGDLDGNGYRIALGLESAPLRVPGAARAGISNWLILGVAAQRQEATDTAAFDDNTGIATTGLFLGKAFGHVESGRSQFSNSPHSNQNQ